MITGMSSLNRTSLLAKIYRCYPLKIKFSPSRFFGNRSYCFYCLEQYPKALADAENSIQLSPDWPKGHFRKGSALMGMKVDKNYHHSKYLIRQMFAECSDQCLLISCCSVLMWMCCSGTVKQKRLWSRCWNWTKIVRKLPMTSTTAKFFSSW